MKEASFETEHKIFAYIFAGGVTAASLPLVIYHAGVVLGIFLAVVVALGLCLSDVVLWFAAHWSVKTQNIAMRIICLLVKFALAGVMLFNAAAILFLMKGDYITDHLLKQQTEARIAEIDARKEAAKELAVTKGGRSASREAMRMNEAQSAESIATNNRQKLEEYVPGWYLDIGVFAAQPLVALLCALIISAAALAIKRREAQAEIEHNREALSADREAGQRAAAESRHYGEGLPRRTWRGGQLINGREQPGEDTQSH